MTTNTKTSQRQQLDGGAAAVKRRGVLKPNGPSLWLTTVTGRLEFPLQRRKKEGWRQTSVSSLANKRLGIQFNLMYKAPNHY